MYKQFLKSTKVIRYVTCFFLLVTAISVISTAYLLSLYGFKAAYPQIVITSIVKDLVSFFLFIHVLLLLKNRQPIPSYLYMTISIFYITYALMILRLIPIIYAIICFLMISQVRKYNKSLEEIKNIELKQNDY